MSFKVNIVVAIGRVSAGDSAARSVIEQVAGKTGGRVGGGVGSSADPIVVEYADKAAAVGAAQQLWYDDTIESAHVVGADELNTAAIKEGTPPAAPAAKVEESADPIEDVRKGGDPKAVVAGLLEKRKAAIAKKADEDRLAAEAAKKVDEKKPAEEVKKPVAESVVPTEAAKIAEMAKAFEAVAKLAEGLTSITATTLAKDATSAAATLTALLATQPVAAAAAK